MNEETKRRQTLEAKILEWSNKVKDPEFNKYFGISNTRKLNNE